MDSYLQTLRNLTKDPCNKPLLHRNSLFPTYEDYLHQHKLKRIHKKQQTQAVIVNDAKVQTGESLSPFGVQSQIQYYPVNRQVVEFEEREVRQKVPVRRKVTELVERKQVELVPKEVVVTDYFAVEHIRKYLKEVVPQVRVETVSVPKIIRREEVLPKEKQIVYYPSHRTDLENAKRDARDYLAQQGVIIRADAEFRPLIQAPIPDTKFVTSKLVETTCDLPDFLPGESKLSPLSQQNKKEMQQINNHAYLALARPKRTPSKPSRFRPNPTKSPHARRYSPLPIYKRQNYEINDQDYSFAERNRYRYEWVMNSSFGRQK